MKGFYSASSVASKPPDSLIPKCGACGLYKNCSSPKMLPFGPGVTHQTKSNILFVSEHVTRSDDQIGKQPSGEIQEFLRKEINKVGGDYSAIHFTSAIACYPKKSSIDAEKIGHCRPKLHQTIKDLKPVLIVPMGWHAVSSVIPLAWEKNPEGDINTWAGWQIPSRKLNTWICPTFDPYYLLHDAPDEVQMLLFQRHLKNALTKKTVPWGMMDRDPRTHIERVMDPKLAAKLLSRIPPEDPIAFDYETNMLKPDSKKAQIVSCAVAYRTNQCIAYPWVGEAIEATSKLLLSVRPKIAANMKFEERWTRAKLGHRVRNWKWDTMQCAHVLDNRKLITGLKFQAFVQCGVPDYSSHIEPFLQSDGGNKPNRIKEVDMSDLLMYNGLDALLEFHLAHSQRYEIRKEIAHEVA